MRGGGRKRKRSGVRDFLRIIQEPEKLRLAALAVIAVFAVSCAILMASRQVTTYGWAYSESPNEGWMKPGFGEKGWTPIDLPFMEFGKKSTAYYRGEIELSGLVKPDVAIQGRIGILRIYVNGEEVEDYEKDGNITITKYGERVTLKPSLFKPGRNLLAVEVKGDGKYRIIGVSTRREETRDSTLFVLFLLSPGLMLIALNRKILESDKAAFFIFLAATLVFLAPIFKDFNYAGSHDWDLMEGINAVQRETIVSYRQIPLWTPYMAGGQSLLADPQSMVLTPFFPAVLLFGVIAGLKLKLILLYMTGLFGMYFLGKQLKLNAYARYVMAFAFMLSSLYSLHTTEGHMQTIAIPLMPWAFLFYLKALEDRRYAIACGLSMAFMLFDAGAYTLIHAAMLLTMYSMLLSLKKIFEGKKIHDVINPAITLLAAGLLCFTFAAVKALPMAEMMVKYPRLTAQDCAGNEGLDCIDAYRGYTAAYLYHAFLGTPQARYVEKLGNSIWYEYGSYVGPFVAILALIGALCCYRKHWPLIVLLFAGVLLSFGTNQSEMILWNLAHKLPVLSSVRYPSRFIIFTLFSVAMLAGIAASMIA
ncbi:MAG: hypothetical protein PHG85_06950, partial [Candidatus Altiarchaeota archaeon]|nr:hypothetical protein [Candidatus Altiarchaeota archaeon]